MGDELQRTCNLIVQIKWWWFHSKIFIFGQIMTIKWCSKCMHIFFGHFWPIVLKFLMGAQETINYRLLIRNPSYDAYFFASLFAGNLAWPPRLPLMMWDFLGQPISRSHAFKMGLTPSSCRHWPDFNQSIIIIIIYTNLSLNNLQRSFSCEIENKYLRLYKYQSYYRPIEHWLIKSVSTEYYRMHTCVFTHVRYRSIK